jgi:hypothetical protein
MGNDPIVFSEHGIFLGRQREEGPSAIIEGPSSGKRCGAAERSVDAHFIKRRSVTTAE